MSTDRFAEVRGNGRFGENPHGILSIDETRLELYGGGDFYCNEGEPDAKTQAKALELAEKYGMEITSAHGEWQGYSEYTPDPGDVSIFYWRRV